MKKTYAFAYIILFLKYLNLYIIMKQKIFL